MESQQDELFEDLPRIGDPRGNFAEFRAGSKIIQIPLSFWKDGRIRADCTEYGAGEHVSRNGTNLQDRVIRALQNAFGTIVEAVRQEFEYAHVRTPTRPRQSNKRALDEEPIAAKRYINPFAKGVWNFSKAPQWLLVRREPSPAEKLVYTRLTYSPREKEEEKICKTKDTNQGVILDLDQTKLANEIGVRRECVCGALKSLKKRGLIEYPGRPGAKGWIKFLWHPWMDQTCALNAQVGHGKPVRSDHRSCAENSQEPLRLPHKTCAERSQLSLCSENREKQRKEKKSHSRQW